MSPVAQLPQTRDDIVELKGGMDQMTPTLQLAPGVARRALNFEAAINGGYTRIAGYERYDGKTSPSSVTFKLLPIIPDGSNQPGIGSTITGASSGTTGKVIALGGSFSTGSPTPYLVVTSVLGSGFQEGEMITGGGGTIIGALGAQTISLSKTLKKQYVNLAADVYRALIGAVPGQGPVRGVFGATFNGQWALYAFRDTEVADGVIRAILYKATPSGWLSLMTGFGGTGIGAQVEFFNGGPVEPAENSTFDYLGTPIVIKRVLLQSGSWAANSAAGWLILNDESGALPAAGGPYVVGGTTFSTKYFATIVSFQAGGSFEFVKHNFSGRLSQARIYGCDGANRAFEFDGEIIAPISTGIESLAPGGFGGVEIVANLDRPTHVVGHHNHLFLTNGSSYFHSGPGLPYNFSAGAGAGEGATGDTITGFTVLPGVQASGALAVMARNQTKVLYGTALAGPEPFDLVNFETETGAIAGTIQKLDRVYYLDDRGVIDLKTAQDYGNFLTATITRVIQKYIQQKHGRAACSMVHRGKGQYRLFFTDGTALYITLDNGKLRGSMPVAFPTPMFCAWSGEDNAGEEVSFLGGTDGYVYQLDRGTSFDGAGIDWELLLNWNPMRSPRQRKTIHRASVEIQDTDYTELRVGARLGPEMSAHLQDDSAVVLSENELTMQWDHFTWDDFWWDAHADAPIEVDVKGTAERVQYAITGSSDYLDSFTVSSIITHYIPRRGLR